jgi:alkaline phosphatase
MPRTPSRRLVRTLVASVAIPTLVVGAAAGGALSADGDRSDEVRRAVQGGTAKNIILLIGDGMGDSEITLARDYEYGAGGRMALDTLPLTGAMTTYSVQESNPSAPDYTSESASTATAWSTGSKTADGRISTAPGTDADLTTILENAQKAGYRTGNVTTSELTDATPAAPMSHVRARGCQGPADMAACPQDTKTAGGPGSIAEQSVDKGVDVLLGGGRARYEQVVTGGPDAGRTVVASAQRQGYQVVTDEAGLNAVKPGGRVLGLFNPSNLAVQWAGAPALRPATGPQRCDENAPTGSEPELSEMTAKALELLSAKPAGRDKHGPGADRGGFFLQVESASIDKRDHAAQPCEQIGETVAFDRAVKLALDFARTHRDTLVLVTADHAHTSQIVEVDAKPAGFSSILTTDEGQRLQVTYGTGDTPAGQGHTGSQIRVAGQGPGAANVVGVIDQTDLFRIMNRALAKAPR